MNNTIILASTPLHLFGAVILSKSFPAHNYHLIYIDQKDKIYFDTLNRWKYNPFKSIDILITDKSSLLSKIKSKRKSIKIISDTIHRLNPQRVIVGNDRKNEISATIQKIKDRVTIEYIDDGIHSYIAEKSGIFKYTFLDNWLKSLIYGTKIYTPKYIGASSYIKSIYLYKPTLKNPHLREKVTYPLDVSILQNQESIVWINSILDTLQIDIDMELKGINSIIFLPHPKELNKSKIDTIKDILKNRDDIALKLHPRDKLSADKFKNTKIIDSKLSAEILFLSMRDNIKIFGFATTALLMAKWLKPKVDVYSIKFDKNSLSDLEIFMQKNRIEIVLSYNMSNFF